EVQGVQQTLHQRVGPEESAAHRFRVGDPVDVFFESGNPTRARALLVKSSTPEALAAELGTVPRVVGRIAKNRALHELTVPGTNGFEVAWSVMMEIATVAGITAMFAVSHSWILGLVGGLGVAAGRARDWLHAAKALGRRQEHQALFRDGHVTTGVLLKLQGRRSGWTRLSDVSHAPVWLYRFEVGGEVVVGEMPVYVGNRSWWFLSRDARQRRRALEAIEEGDPVLVLYDPEDPSKNCCVPLAVATLKGD
ncbi:MAG: hypothetical protein QF464_02825, partial [Myxococcota bacterium]|nr:hypothetical protein [Myxococcota bacterium]